MGTRSQRPGYKLQGMFLDCFTTYFSKQACNTARSVREAALQLTGATSGLIGRDEVLFQ